MNDVAGEVDNGGSQPQFCTSPITAAQANFPTEAPSCAPNSYFYFELIFITISECEDPITYGRARDEMDCLWASRGFPRPIQVTLPIIDGGVVAQMQYKPPIIESPVVRDADLSKGQLLSRKQINVVHCQSAWDFARLACVKISPSHGWFDHYQGVSPGLTIYLR